MEQNDLPASAKATADRMEKIVSLCKRRGFVFPGSEIYGGLANSWDYGPLGVELKNNIKQLWWKRFVHQREDMVGLDAALIMNPKVWEASGHVSTFSDPLVEDKKTNERFRLDHLLEEVGVSPAGMSLEQMWQAALEKGLKSPAGNLLSEPKQFNLMFKTYIGPSEDQTSIAYFRPETAQAMFVQFKSVLDTTRKRLPFGIAQQGKAFRNEITPGNFIFRTREFEQMEIEYFIPVPASDEDWNEYFENWRGAILDWITNDLKLKPQHIHELEVPKADLAHYSKRTVDFEYEFPFGTKELYGLAYRTDFDLQNHEKASGQELKFVDPDTGEKFTPHVIEPTWGVDRTFLALLSEHFDDSDPAHVVLRLPARLAPYKAAVFPLLKNKPELVEKAKGIYSSLQNNFCVAWDDRGNVGKRYYSQDEIGTPFCVTVDFQTLEDDTVTVRDRDTALQERIGISELESYIAGKM
jgi:glycyl-tRNA synthetase